MALDRHYQTLGVVPCFGSLNNACIWYYKLAEQYHPDHVDNQYLKTHYRSKLNDLDNAWEAIQEHFFEVNNTPEPERRKEWFFSDAELLEKAKEDQEYRREQPRGYTVVPNDPEKLLPGLYEEYERVRGRNKGYIFDGEAVVVREKDIDTIVGAPTFKNTIFTKPIVFAAQERMSYDRTGRWRPSRPWPAHKPTPWAKFEKETVFNEKVQFNDLRVEFKGPVTFLKKAVFEREVVFYDQPNVNSEEGIEHQASVKQYWRAQDLTPQSARKGPQSPFARR